MMVKLDANLWKDAIEDCHQVSLTMTVFLFTILARTCSFDSYEFVLLDRSETKVSMDAVSPLAAGGEELMMSHICLCVFEFAERRIEFPLHHK